MNSSRIEPMPGEPALAHQGRVALFLGLKIGKQFKELVRQHLQENISDVSSLSKLGQLAAISGMTLADYARQHSMLGVFRVVVSAKDWAPFGSSDDARYVRSQGMLIHKSEVCLCPQCVKEDLDHWKFSWFRRSHQIEGVAWCPSHKIRLLRVTANSPWSRLPQHWVESGDVGEIPVDHESATEFETRYAEIAMAMLERAAPLKVDALGRILTERAQSLGLRWSIAGKRKNLSDLVKQVAPSHWLEVHWPALVCKKPGEFILGLDRVIVQRRLAQRGTGYLTAMAAMWDSTLELHQALQLVKSIKPEHLEVVPQEGKKTVEFWHGEVWDAYLRHEGIARSMASEIGVDQTYLRIKLTELGLPSFRGLTTSPRWRAFLRFEAGETLCAACEAEKADMDEVQALVRMSCARVATAARKTFESRTARKQDKTGNSQIQGRSLSKVTTPIPSNVD